MKKQYPLMIDLTGRDCLVVGGGGVALRKAASLAAAGAIVTLISPELHPDLAEMVACGQVHWRKEPFGGQDVSGYDLVVAATDQPEVNFAVYQAVAANRGWINIVDRPDLCNFIVPSSVHRGKLVISVSTSGASPALARKIKQKIEQEFGPEYEQYLDFLAQMRRRVLAEVENPEKRRQLFQQLLDDAFLHASKEQQNQMAEALLERCKTGGAQGGNDETVESRFA
ncbi:bifunctional precorrin-2 dehydrogenase/sirohydrochlorin ferrochelatase [Brevibacillus sp. B_LB10_24]|uniref:precorrin-2 dehydrogenase/sirohydrochlorin ferrochelatase family protein n=1 Tax=Brevibacillus sp. B_LB10_24 TaxID=3380645 RepID=UPI0038BCCB6C